MRIAIYSPYLDTAGGGEKYVLTIAEVLSKDHQVDVLLDAHLISLGIEAIKSKIEKLHHLDLSKVKFIKAPLGRGSNFLDKFFFLKKYEVLFYNTDGSIFYSTAKKNIVHFQVPLKNITTTGVWGSIKLSSWNLAIYNSKFTKEIVEKTLTIKGKVVYPPVDVEKIKPLKKKKIILSVGRFAKAKKHEVVVDAFKKMDLAGWSLHIVGGEDDKEYLADLKDQANGQPIFFHPNLQLYDLIKLYGEAMVYWHSAGFGESDPKNMEHFGISTVEAMAAGCVPVVIKAGGQPEIVEDGRSGFLWDNQDELISLTKKLINDQKLWTKLSKNAISRSRLFSKEKFDSNILEIVNGSN